MKVMINDKAVERRVHPGEDKTGNKEKIKKHKGKKCRKSAKVHFHLSLPEHAL